MLLNNVKVCNLGSKEPYFSSTYFIGGCKLNAATVGTVKIEFNRNFGHRIFVS